jgi:hypothetical protein
MLVSGASANDDVEEWMLLSEQGLVCLPITWSLALETTVCPSGGLTASAAGPASYEGVGTLLFLLVTWERVTSLVAAIHLSTKTGRYLLFLYKINPVRFHWTRKSIFLKNIKKN